MRIARHIAAAMLGGAALFAFATPAAAKPATSGTPQVAWVKDTVVANSNRATVTAKYRCWGGRAGSHVWVSVKQGGTDLEGEGSSARAKAWYDTNWKYAQDPAGMTLRCDGYWQVQEFKLKRVEGWQGLVKGTAYVQFCAFDNKGNLAYNYDWKRIRVER
ncbi:hypothetical protein [Dactylosporangium sp. NPDC000521]|uniref:hypothetical protein n=1 Tax=Dactylosporangium sp. NPDC000521 TaxID=3363975 RepID=UPI0036CB3ADD